MKWSYARKIPRWAMTAMTLDIDLVRPQRLTHMKSVSVREFYHNAGLVDGLPEGRQLIVTARGKPKFMVTKGVRPRMTRALAEARAVGNGQAAAVDGVAFLNSLKR
jgi:antitoxin (DNA-binding transcriptional repressor) of toxin-antitoxin stability system